MTTYNRSDRQRLRYRLRRWQRLINAMLALSLAIATLVAVADAASAQTWDRCWRIPHGTVCVARAAKVTRIACDWGYQPRFGQPPRCVALGMQP